MKTIKKNKIICKSILDLRKEISKYPKNRVEEAVTVYAEKYTEIGINTFMQGVSFTNNRIEDGDFDKLYKIIDSKSDDYIFKSRDYLDDDLENEMLNNNLLNAYEKMLIHNYSNESILKGILSEIYDLDKRYFVFYYFGSSKDIEKGIFEFTNKNSIQLIQLTYYDFKSKTAKVPHIGKVSSHTDNEYIKISLAGKSGKNFEIYTTLFVNTRDIYDRNFDKDFYYGLYIATKNGSIASGGFILERVNRNNTSDVIKSEILNKEFLYAHLKTLRIESKFFMSNMGNYETVIQGINSSIFVNHAKKGLYNSDINGEFVLIRHSIKDVGSNKLTFLPIEIKNNNAFIYNNDTDGSPSLYIGTIEEIENAELGKRTYNIIFNKKYNLKSDAIKIKSYYNNITIINPHIDKKNSFYYGLGNASNKDNVLCSYKCILLRIPYIISQCEINNIISYNPKGLGFNHDITFNLVSDLNSDLYKRDLKLFNDIKLQYAKRIEELISI